MNVKNYCQHWYWGMCPPPHDISLKSLLSKQKKKKMQSNAAETASGLRAKAYAPPFLKSWICPSPGSTYILNGINICSVGLFSLLR